MSANERIPGPSYDKIQEYDYCVSRHNEYYCQNIGLRPMSKEQEDAMWECIFYKDYQTCLHEVAGEKYGTDAVVGGAVGLIISIIIIKWWKQRNKGGTK